MITSRRSFLTGLGAVLVAAPAIVRAGSLMPVKQMIVIDNPWLTEPIVKGVVYQTWPFGEVRPLTDFYSGMLFRVGEDAERPLSFFTDKLADHPQRLYVREKGAGCDPVGPTAILEAKVKL
jgi:hypothetical protein